MYVYIHIHAHAHTYVYIYIYLYMTVMSVEAHSEPSPKSPKENRITRRRGGAGHCDVDAHHLSLHRAVAPWHHGISIGDGEKKVVGIVMFSLEMVMIWFIFHSYVMLCGFAFFFYTTHRVKPKL